MSGENTCGNYLIYTEPLVSEIRDYLRNTDQQDEEEKKSNVSYNTGLRRAMQSICCAPAVDAVEVVRCKECFYHKDSCFAGEGNIYCDVHMKYFPKDGFCSSGERRKENEID